MVAKVTGSRCSSSGAKERAGERLSKNDRQPRNQPHVIRIREDRNRRIRFTKTEQAEDRALLRTS